MSTFIESLASKTVKHLENSFPGKTLVFDRNMNITECDRKDYEAIPIYTKEVENTVHYKTNIRSLNQYLS